MPDNKREAAKQSVMAEPCKCAYFGGDEFDNSIAAFVGHHPSCGTKFKQALLPILAKGAATIDRVQVVRKAFERVKGTMAEYNEEHVNDARTDCDRQQALKHVYQVMDAVLAAMEVKNES